MGDFLHWGVLETLLVLQGWIPAAFPTPTQAEKLVRKVHCAPSFIERDKNVLSEMGTSGNLVTPQALKLCILENSLFFLPGSCVPLEIQVFAVRAGSPAPQAQIASYRQLSHSPSAFIWVFCCLFQEQEGVSHHCQRLHLARLALRKCPNAVSSLARFFSILLNLHLHVGRSEPIPTLKSCCDAPAISHLTAEAEILSFPQCLKNKKYF